jgi:hypothetical protein
MNFINIKSVKTSLLVLMAMLFATACEDEDKAPIVTFDSAGKGAYVKFVDQSGATLINLLSQADFDASSYTYSVEFVDGENGARVTSYDLQVSYNNGDPVALRSYSASEFTAQATVRGGLGVSNVTITAADVTSPFGLSYTDLTPGDEFEVTGTITTENGTYGGSNSSASVAGGAFQGFFDITMPAACPSSLEGTYDYASSNIWCDGSSTTGTVDIIAMGGGKYRFSDWSFGGYGVCYGGGAAGSEGLTFTDVCTVVSFTGFVDVYGDTWTYVSSITGDDWTITWDNTYGESGTGVVTIPGLGFTLAP